MTTYKSRLSGRSSEYPSDRSYYGKQSIPAFRKRDALDARLKDINQRRDAIRRKREEVQKAFENLSNVQWPEDMMPAESTVQRARELWKRVEEDILAMPLPIPNISAADENSIDFFWGNHEQRLLLNIPADVHEALFLHLIKDNGHSIAHFSDSHTHNLLNALKELWHA